jgi:hypothetical protein
LRTYAGSLSSLLVEHVVHKAHNTPSRVGRLDAGSDRLFFTLMWLRKVATSAVAQVITLGAHPWALFSEHRNEINIKMSVETAEAEERRALGACDAFPHCMVVSAQMAKAFLARVNCVFRLLKWAS